MHDIEFTKAELFSYHSALFMEKLQGIPTEMSVREILNIKNSG